MLFCVGGGRKLDDAGRRKTLEHREGEVGAGVMGLIHDHDRPVRRQYVG